MLKVLYLPLGEQPGMYDAWRNIGVDLHIYDYWSDWLQNNNQVLIRDRFLEKVKDIQPDLIHMQLQFTGLLTAENLLQAKKISPKSIIVNWSGDVRTNAPGEFTCLADTLDFTLISSTGQLELYKQSGCHNIRYWQIGYDPKVAYPIYKKEFIYDITFTGNNYGGNFPDGQIREAAAQQLKNTFGDKFGLFGSGYANSQGCTSPQQSNAIYNDSLCLLSISHFNNIAHYFSDRLLLCLGSGRPVISWYFPNYEDYFVDGKDIFIARTNQEIIDIVNYCKNNPEEATKVGINGYKKALKEHTFTSRAIELLHITNLTDLV